MGLFFLISCAPKPTDVKPSPAPQATAKPVTPSATPLPPVQSLTPNIHVQQIITTGELNLRVGEELMLIGDAMLSNGQKVSLDSVMSRLSLNNQNPDLMQLNSQTRVIKALKPGTAVVLVAATDNPGLQVLVRIQISDATAIDPNIALIDVEVE
ncbi:MAG: hypothetical protein ACAI44_28100 [Candidatus Sericytochromatia bacterium]